MAHPAKRGDPKPDRLKLAERAYYAIRERILKGEIPLGAPLSRRKLAAEFGMSLLPVSVAFQALENDGLVESQPRVGTRVYFPTTDEIRQHYQVREALESQSARLYAERAGALARRELKEMAEHVDALFNQSAAPQGSNRDFLYAVHSDHLGFHLRIAEGADCPALRQLIERNHVLIFNWLFDVAADRPPLPPRFHRDLAEALNTGSIEAADRAMRRHVRHGLDKIIEALGSRDRSGRIQRVK